jgi:hypothetical protein
MKIEFAVSAAQSDRYSFRGARVVEAQENDRPCAYVRSSTGNVVLLGAVRASVKGKYQCRDLINLELTVDEVRTAVKELRDAGVEI